MWVQCQITNNCNKLGNLGGPTTNFLIRTRNFKGIYTKFRDLGYLIIFKVPKSAAYSTVKMLLPLFCIMYVIYPSISAISDAYLDPGHSGSRLSHIVQLFVGDLEMFLGQA